ncbi:MAG: autotransporter domain-containing protein [Phycisphaerae bacterium]
MAQFRSSKKGKKQQQRRSNIKGRFLAATVVSAVMGMPGLAGATLEPISISSIVSNINTFNLLNPNVLSGTVTINTGNGGTPTLTAGGTTYNGQLVSQANGSTVAVFAFSGNVTTGTISVTGGSLPVAIYSTGNMTVGNVAADGSIGGTGTQVTASSGVAPPGGAAGPGGFAGGNGGAASYIGLAGNGAGPGGGTGGPVQGSGGGGGFGGAGGTGFVFPNVTPGTSGPKVAGGGANGNLATQLEGGSGGGGGSGLLGNAGGGGGGGGGAVAFIANGQITVTGSIHANGGSGGTGYYGGGGGAGGGVIIASLGLAGGTITSSGAVAAIGGNSGYFQAGAFAGGGGGGGRILEYYRQWNVSSGGFNNLSVAAGTYAGGNGAYNGQAGSVEILADATYIASGTYLNISGTGSNTKLKDSSAGYSIPLTFETGAFNVNGVLTLNNASQTISTLSGTGSVVLTGSNLTFDPAAGVSSTFNGIISGTGTITLDGPGDLFLAGTNTYSGGTIADGGVLGVFSSKALGTGNLTIGGGTVYLPFSGTNISNSVTLTGGTSNFIAPAAVGGTVTLSGVISGGGSMTVNGTPNSTLAITAANTYTGGTNINNGIVEVSGSGTLGTGAVNINSPGELALSADNLTVSQLTGNGTASLGSSDLTIANTSGGTDTFNGSITGTGGLTVGGSSPLVLAGTNTYTGGTTINSGANLLIASQSALAAGAVINNGNFGLTGGFTNATIAGNYTQGGSGVLTTRLSGSSPGQFDQFHVTGTASVNGALNVVLLNHYDATSSPTTIAVLTSTGSSTGNFTSINLGNHPINLFASSVDTGNGINLIFTLQQPSLVPYALTPNQIAVAQYIDSTDGYQHLSNPSPAYQELINAIDSSYSQEIPGILDMLSPIDLQAFPQVAVQNGINLDQTISSHLQNLDAGATGFDSSGFTMLDPGQQGGSSLTLDQMLQDQSRMVTLDAGLPSYLGYSAANPYSPSTGDQSWSAFITGAAQFDSYSDTSSIGSSNVTTENATIGADYAFFKYLSVGAFFNYDHSDINLDSFGSTGTVNGYTPGVYADLHGSHWFLDGMAAYTYMDNSESRNIAINYYSATANGNFSGNSYNGAADLGYRLYSTSQSPYSPLSGWTLIPMVSLGYTHADYNSFSETGAGAAGLNVSSMSADSFRSMLSATFLYTIHLSPQSTLVPGILLGWRHEYLNNSQGITAQLQGAGTGSFTVNTAEPVRDVAVIAPSLNINFNKNISGFVDYELDLGSNKFHAQQVFAGLAVSF